MKKMPLCNQLQAIETMLDSYTQKHKKDAPEIQKVFKALFMVRSMQRRMYGNRMVKEWTLRRHFNPREYDHANFKNWNKNKMTKHVPKLESFQGAQ